MRSYCPKQQLPISCSLGLDQLNIAFTKRGAHLPIVRSLRLPEPEPIDTYYNEIYSSINSSIYVSMVRVTVMIVTALCQLEYFYCSSYLGIPLYNHSGQSGEHFFYKK